VLDAAGAQALGERVAARVASLPEYASARTIGIYAATPEELPTRPLFRAAREAGRRCALPRIRAGRVLEFAIADRWENLRAGRYGLLEPGPECEALAVGALDLLFVPGLAFDARGGRLGRGGGYYDRALAAEDPASHGTAVFGLAHDWQVVEHVPRDERDRLVDGVVTERRVLRAAPASADAETIEEGTRGRVR